MRDILDELMVFNEVSGTIKNVIRGGEVKKITACPDGYRLTPEGKCAKMTSAERMMLSKRAIKAARTRKPSEGQSAISREKSLKIRRKQPGPFFKVKTVNL